VPDVGSCTSSAVWRSCHSLFYFPNVVFLQSSVILAFFYFNLFLKMGEELVFCLFELADTKQLLIGSIESIRIPRGFDTRSVTDNLKILAKFSAEKTEIGVK